MTWFVSTYIIFLVIPELTVRFEHAEYTFMEDAGTVQACALVTGRINPWSYIPLSLTLYTEDDTAHGIVIEHCCSDLFSLARLSQGRRESGLILIHY